MKTLERFWQWFDSETPSAKDALAMARKNLSAVASEHLQCAAGQICVRTWPNCDWTNDALLLNAIALHAAPLRDLSLGIGRALEAMRAAVPEVKPDFRREYLGEWAGRDYSLLAIDELKEWQLPSMPADTFRGVDRPKEEPRLSGFRVPQSFNYRDPLRQCPCGTCRAARAKASKQAQALGIDAQQYLVATHDGLVPFDPNATQPPSEQQRNDYEQRAQALQAVDATHPRNVYTEAFLREMW